MQRVSRRLPWPQEKEASDVRRRDVSNEVKTLKPLMTTAQVNACLLQLFYLCLDPIAEIVSEVMSQTEGRHPRERVIACVYEMWEGGTASPLDSCSYPSRYAV